MVPESNRAEAAFSEENAESQSKRRTIWECSVSHDQHELETFISWEAVEILAMKNCYPVLYELCDWLAPRIGKLEASRLGDSLTDILVELSSLSVAAGIAVERTRSLAEKDPRVDVLKSPNPVRWLALALAESGLEPYSPKSLIPADESKAIACRDK